MASISIEGTPVALASGGGIPDFPISTSGHLLIVFTDDSGNEFVIRGGPTAASSPFGPLVLQVGIPLASSFDARASGQTAEDRGSVTLDLGGRDANDVWEILKQHATNLHNQALEYIPFDFPSISESTNSNGTVGNLLHTIGIDILQNIPDPAGMQIIPFHGFAEEFHFQSQIVGTDGNDEIHGRDEQDIFIGGAGRDELHGGDGNDLLFGATVELGHNGIPDFSSPQKDAQGNFLFGGTGFDAYYIHAAAERDENTGGNTAPFDLSETALARMDRIEDADGRGAIFLALEGPGAPDPNFSFSQFPNITFRPDQPQPGADMVWEQTNAGSAPLKAYQIDSDIAIFGNDGDGIFMLQNAGEPVPPGSSAASSTTQASVLSLSSPSMQSSMLGIRFVDRMNQISGTEADDVLAGTGADDFAQALGGNDTINLGDGNDVADAGDGNDIINGGSGYDDLQGDAGNDTIDGGEGDDDIAGGADDDTLDGGAGNDTIDGGSGNDTASYASAGAGVAVDLSHFGGQDTGGAGIDRLSDIENLTGSSFDDFLIGDDGDNAISGGDGLDKIRGGEGADILDGGAGDKDWLQYVGSSAGVNVDLATGVVSGGDAEGDTISGFERVVGSKHDDTLTGDASDNRLNGGRGADTLSGEDGDDYIRGGEGADFLDGGSGLGDWVEYNGSDAGVSINLSTNVVSGGEAYGDTISNFENVNGSGFDDTLVGTDDSNKLRGRDGDDIIQAGDGDDFVRGGAGSDSLDGGLGIDWLEYVGSAAGVDVNLEIGTASGGDAQGDSISNFEHVRGTDFDDTLTGDSADNKIRAEAGDDNLSGRGGKDRLFGAEGADVLDGGTENDALFGGTGSDTFVFASTTGTDRVKDWEIGVDQIDLTDFGIGDAATALAMFEQNGDHVRLNQGSDRLIIENVLLSDLSTADLIV